MARAKAGSAYTSADLQKPLAELNGANGDINDRLSSEDEDVPTDSPAPAQRQIDRKGKGKGRASTGKPGRPRKSVKGKKPVNDASLSLAGSMEVLQGLASTAIGQGARGPGRAAEQQRRASTRQSTTDTAAVRLKQAPNGAVEAAALDSKDQPLPATQSASPAKRKRGRPSKADQQKAAEEADAASAEANVAAADPVSSSAAAGPSRPRATANGEQPISAKRKKHSSKGRRQTSTPPVEVEGSLFSSQYERDKTDHLFIAPSDDEAVSDTPAPVQSTSQAPAKRKRTDSHHTPEGPPVVQQPAMDLSESEVGSDVDELEDQEDAPASTSADEAEVQKSLVQELPPRNPRKRQKIGLSAATNASSSASASDPRPPINGVLVKRRSKKAATSIAAASPVRPASKGKPGKSSVPVRKSNAGPMNSDSQPVAGPSSTPAKAADKGKGKARESAQASQDRTAKRTPRHQGDASSPPHSSQAVAPLAAGWLRDRWRKLSVRQKESLLAHRERDAARVRGQAWSTDEEICIILALNDMFDEYRPPGSVDLTTEEINRLRAKRWRELQKLHGADGELSTLLSTRSNVDLKDKARNIQKYREQKGLPGFSWYPRLDS